MLKKIWGKLYGNKGYVGKTLSEVLFNDGINFVTGIRSNMKNVFMELRDKIMLRRKSIIETVNDQLKNNCIVEHSRHRFFHNFVNNFLAAISAYSFLPKTSAVRFYDFPPSNSNQLDITF